ncbi:DUF4349 domain-containing protein [Actinotalea sp. JY-7876]|uniref:DUF4349 domain-containing protein n=2 Tax=unclassified Actinotalea TaxID=2638618 RepID=UPI0015F5E99A|nr:DUF4349 domain-containing protein [Actinotalea sp. JY-7876]
MRSLMQSLAVVAVLLVAGCSGGGADSGAGGAQPHAARSEEGAVSDEGAGGEQSFVVTGSVSMLVEDPAVSVAEAAQLVEDAGGHVQERVEQGGADDDYAWAELVARIPADEVTETLEELKGLGEVRDTSIQSEEVTDQVRDLDARIRALEISITRLEELLGRAGTVSEIVEAEQVLTERQSELEVLLGQQAALADDIALSTFRIEMWTEGAAPEEPATGFWAGLVNGWNALLATLTGLLQAIGTLLPWLAFAALVAAVVLFVRRALPRRRAARPSATPRFGPGGATGPTTSLPPQGGPTGPVPPSGPPTGPVAPGGAPAPSGPPTSVATMDPVPAPEPSGAATQDTAPAAVAPAADRPASTAPLPTVPGDPTDPLPDPPPPGRGSAPAPAPRKRTPRARPPRDTPPGE